MLRFLPRHAILILCTASATLGQTPPTTSSADPSSGSKNKNEFSQQNIDAAMARLRQRQRERANATPATTQPTTQAGDWPASGEHTLLKTSQRKAQHISECLQSIAAFSKTASRDKFAKEQLDASRSLLDALRACTPEQYRDATVDCWNRNDAELKRQWDMWDTKKLFDSLFEKARSLIRQDASIRSIQLSPADPGMPPMQSDGSREVIRSCRFEFVTKGGLVRVYDGCISISATPGGRTIVDADVDGTLHVSETADLAGMEPAFWPWPCKWVTLKGIEGRLVVGDSSYLPPKVQPPDFAAIQAQKAAEAHARQLLNAGAQRRLRN